MKSIIWVGFIFDGMTCSLTLDSETRVDFMAGWRQAIELALSEEDVTRLSAVARSRAELASRVERARILLAYWENQSFFCGGAGYRGAPSDCPALRRTGPGLWSDGGARRSAEARQGTDDQSRSQGMGCGSRLPQGQRTRLSARIVALQLPRACHVVARLFRARCCRGRSWKGRQHEVPWN